MKKTETIIISIASVIIVIALVSAITLSFAYMKTQAENETVTEVNLTSCAKISLTDTSSINLSNTYPMSKNQALKNTPYTFTVTSSCEENVGFNLYLATVSTNTLGVEKIHYIIIDKESQNTVKEGIIGDLSDVSSTFTSAEINEYNIGMNNTVSKIYMLYNEGLDLKGSKSYDLYLYVDEEVTTSTSASETFIGGIAVKSYDL